MKRVELTKLHKAKLLEMCNKLLSEQGIWFAILDNEIYYSENGKYPGYAIPWFELCVPHLISKFNNWHILINFIERTEVITGCSTNKYKISHPIDYIYEEFKKLK